MSPTFTRKGTRLYRYYISQSVLKLGPETCPVRRVGAAEIRTGIEQVRAFLLANSMSRFMAAWEDETKVQLREIAGFRKREADNTWDFFVTTAAWRAEVCAGMDGQALARQLAERGLLVVPATGKRQSKSMNVPGFGKLRLYHLSARFLAEDSGND